MAELKTVPAFDLQAHSTHSDGALSPKAVVERAAAAGVVLFALTDHDTVDGVAEAIAHAPMRVIPAVELSSVHDGHEDLHILGYGAAHTAPRLLAPLRDYRDARIRRIHAMADNLRALGFDLDPAYFDRPAPGRPHLAAALTAAGAPGTRDELFATYLVPGTPTYVGRSRPTVQEAIDVIHRAGGLAVWAHPYWDVEHAEASLRTFASMGLDGVEAFYVTHTEPQTRHLHALARELGLITTGSTDFHGPAHEHFNRFRGFELYGLEPDLGRLLED